MRQTRNGLIIDALAGERNRTREAGNRDEVEGAMANTLKFSCNGAVGFIDWLGCRTASCGVHGNYS